MHFDWAVLLLLVAAPSSFHSGNALLLHAFQIPQSFTQQHFLPRGPCLGRGRWRYPHRFRALLTERFTERKNGFAGRLLHSVQLLVHDKTSSDSSTAKPSHNLDDGSRTEGGSTPTTARAITTNHHHNRYHQTPLPTQKEAGSDPVVSLNLNLRHVVRSGEFDAAKRAEQLLLRVENLHRDGYYTGRPDVVSYNTVLNAWARESGLESGKRRKVKGGRIGANSLSAARRAERLLCRLEDLKSEEQEREHSLPLSSSSSFPQLSLSFLAAPQPDAISYNTVINAWARSPEKGSCDKAARILERMERQFRDGNIRARPDTVSYNSVIDAYAKAGLAKKAEEVLARMSRMSERGNVSVCPNARSVNAVLNAWSRVAAAKSKSLKSRKTRKESRMDLRKARNVAAAASCRAVSLLEEMHRQYEGGNSNMKPNVCSYSTVMSALARCDGGEEAAMKTERLLDIMETKWVHHGNLDAKPNLFSYGSAIAAWARVASAVPGAAQRAEDVLERMAKARVPPDAMAYSMSILAWTRSREENDNGESAVDAAERAQRLLDRMERLYRSGREDMKPSVQTYGAVIDKWAKSNRAERAHQLLRRMSDLGGDAANTICYNAVINAYARSDTMADKARRAWDLLCEMRKGQEENGDRTSPVRPDVISYNSVINACATTTTVTVGATEDDEMKRGAMEIAMEAFREVHEIRDLKPSGATYAFFLKACASLLPFSRHNEAEHAAIVKNAFRLCREAGRVNKRVLFRLKEAAPEGMYEELMLSKREKYAS